jgi:hypothetical protein
MSKINFIEDKEKVLEAEILDKDNNDVNNNFALDEVLRSFNSFVEIFKVSQNRKKVFIDLFIDLGIIKTYKEEINHVEDFESLSIYEIIYNFILENKDEFLNNIKLKPIFSLFNYLYDEDSMNKYSFNDFEKDYRELINLTELQFEFDKLISKLKKNKKTA